MFDLLCSVFVFVSRMIAACALGALLFVVLAFLAHVVYCAFVFSGAMLIAQIANGFLCVIAASVLPMAAYACSSDVDHY